MRMSDVHLHRRAFSLIETIVAAVILSGAVLAISAISTKNIRGIKLNREYELAWDLLDRQLTMIDYMGIETFLEMGETSGVFTEEVGGDGFFWQVQTAEEEADYLYIVDIVVGWNSGMKLRQVSLRTMLNGQGMLEETEGQEEGQTQGQS